MGLFNKWFASKPKATTQPDNTKLFQLLEIYQQQNGKGDSYKNVVLELMNGNSYLLLPSQNDDEGTRTWTTTETNTSLKLTCVFDLDGLKVLGAFTDEASLVAWSKKPTQYTALPSKDVLKLCEEQLIERIVINSDLPTMLVMERNRANVKTEIMKETTTVQVGTPNKPLEKRILQKLIDQFKRVRTIDEVYQYAQMRNNEFSIVLGFRLLTNSENARIATVNAVQTALQGENISQFLDLFFIEDEDGYQAIRNVNNSLVYKR